jgi:hypothetical protein
MVGQHPDPAPFIKQAHHILDEANQRNITLRLVGALAFHIHCPAFNYIQKESQRYFTDVDFMAYVEQKSDIEKMFAEMGYREDPRIKTVPGLRRSIFFTRDHAWHSDVFYDVLDFSHEVNFKGRLKIDYPTISLVDLLLEKMQIVKINEKDVIDTIMLLLEHPFGEDDDEMVNMRRVAGLCAADWGLWRTLTMNLDKVRQLAQAYPQLSRSEKAHIASQVDQAVARIEAEPKSLAWRLRARVGDRVKWYKDVEEVE